MWPFGPSKPSPELLAARANLQGAASALDATKAQMETAGKAGIKVGEDMIKLAKEQETAFKSAKQNLGMARKGIGASIKQVGINIGETVRLTPSPKTAAEEAARLVDKGGAGFSERFLGKPFRFAAKHAVGTLIVGGLAAIAVVGSIFKGRAEKRTMENAQTEVNAAAARAQANAYTVTPEEYAAMEARMRQNGAGGKSHADAVQAAREAAASQAPIAQNV